MNWTREQQQVVSDTTKRYIPFIAMNESSNIGVNIIQRIGHPDFLDTFSFSTNIQGINIAKGMDESSNPF